MKDEQLSSYELENQINELDDLDAKGLLDEEGFMNRLSLILMLANKKPTRVWGEYNQVAQLTTQAVLMNKATAIELSMAQVVGLVDELSKTYSEQLKAVRISREHLARTKGKVPVRFSATNMRGHADPTIFEINLSKLGDWRMGRNLMYSAELVFHEFAHVIDFDRRSSGKGTASARSDGHKHDFVHILDNMLLKYKDWINSRYNAEFHKNQILDNQARLHYFEFNKEKIISLIARREKLSRDEREASEGERHVSKGVSDNVYPLSLLLIEDTKLKKGYIDFSIAKALEDARYPDKKLAYRKLLAAVESDNPVLDKEQISYFTEVFDNRYRNLYINTLPMMQQMKASPIIKAFEKDLIGFGQGKVADLLEQEPSLIIERYSEDDIIENDSVEVGLPTEQLEEMLDMIASQAR